MDERKNKTSAVEAIFPSRTSLNYARPDKNHCKKRAQCTVQGAPGLTRNDKILDLSYRALCNTFLTFPFTRKEADSFPCLIRAQNCYTFWTLDAAVKSASVSVAQVEQQKIRFPFVLVTVLYPKMVSKTAELERYDLQLLQNQLTLIMRWLNLGLWNLRGHLKRNLDKRLMMCPELRAVESACSGQYDPVMNLLGRDGRNHLTANMKSQTRSDRYNFQW